MPDVPRPVRLSRTVVELCRRAETDENRERVRVCSEQPFRVNRENQAGSLGRGLTRALSRERDIDRKHAYLDRRENKEHASHWSPPRPGIAGARVPAPPTSCIRCSQYPIRMPAG